MEKNIHPNFEALSEAEFKERRVVFVGAEAPAGGGEEAGEAAEVNEGLNLQDSTQKALDKAARGYLTCRLQGIAKLAVPKMTVMAAEKNASGEVSSVTTKMNGIQVTISDEHSDGQISKFQADAVKYQMQFAGLKFRDGSHVDISNEKALLLIEIDDSFKDATTNDLTVDIDVSTDTISDIRLDPSTSSEELRRKIDSLKNQPVASLTRQVLQELVTLQTQASEADTDRGLAAADGATEDASAKVTEELPPVEDEGTPPVIDLGKLLVTGGLGGINKDNFKDGQTMIVPIGRDRVEVTVHKEGGRISFTCELPLFEGVKIPFELKDNGTAVMKFGDREIILRFESSTSGGKITMEGLGARGKDKFEIEFKSSVEMARSGMSATVDIVLKFNGEPVEEDAEFDFVSLFGGGDNLRQAGFTDEALQELRSMPFAPSASMDDGSGTEAAEGADGAEVADGDSEGGDTDNDKKGRSTLDRVLGPGASENVGSFMETLEELAAVVLELLESLGFDLNPDRDKNGKERTPAEREGRRLWLFIGRNQLGMKNRGKLQSMKMDELMALYDDNKGEQAKTVTALRGAGFDTEGVHGEKLHEMLEHIHDIKDQGDGKSEDGKGAEKVSDYFDANGSRMNLNTFLFKTKMIDMNGRWSNGWEEFDGKTDEEIAADTQAAVAEAAKQRDKEQLSTILKNSEYMISILYDEDPKNRNTLADKLQGLNIITAEAVKAFKDGDSTEDGLRTLLNTIEDKAYFFGKADFDINTAWPNLPDVAAIKTMLENTDPGSAKAEEIADHFVSAGLPLGYDASKKVIKVEAAKKGEFQTLLSQPISDIEASFNLLDTDGRTNFATNVGLKPEDLPTLIGWLHDPEHGQYRDTDMALVSIYGPTTAKKYTLADLLSVMMTPAASAETPAAAVTDTG